MKMKNQKSLLLLLLFLILSLCATALLSASSLRLVKKNKQQQEQLEKGIDDYYLAVMYNLDAQQALYRVLGNLTEKAAQDSQNEELRIYLNGVVDGVQMSHSGVEEDLYGIYTEIFAKDRKLAQSVREFMRDVLYANRNTLNFEYLSSAELENISDLYHELEKCFSRADGNFGDLLINRRFEGQAFQSSMDKVSGLIAQLEEYHAGIPAKYSLFEDN